MIRMGGLAQANFILWFFFLLSSTLQHSLFDSLYHWSMSNIMKWFSIKRKLEPNQQPNSCNHLSNIIVNVHQFDTIHILSYSDICLYMFPLFSSVVGMATSITTITIDSASTHLLIPSYYYCCVSCI
jgi:hypothetical protein